jgi:hypothetical protein
MKKLYNLIFQTSNFIFQFDIAFLRLKIFIIIFFLIILHFIFKDTYSSKNIYSFHESNFYVFNRIRFFNFGLSLFHAQDFEGIAFGKID